MSTVPSVLLHTVQTGRNVKCEPADSGRLVIYRVARKVKTLLFVNKLC